MSDESEFEKELDKYIAELKVSLSAKEREKLNYYRKKWREANKEKLREESKEHREKNRENLREYFV